MGRLLDEDDVRNRFNKLYGGEYSASELLDDISTAFDKERVVEELEELSYVHEMDDIVYDKVIDLSDAVKAVKKGGV